MQTLIRTYGEERERSSIEINRAMMIYTPCKSGSLIYKSRLSKGGLGNWSEYSCVTATLLHLCLKRHLQKQLATTPVLTPILIVVVADV